MMCNRMAFVFVVCLTQFVAAVEPNYVKTTVYNYDAAGNATTVEATEFSDGLGRSIQTQVQGSDGRIITSTMYDEVGRPVKTTLPFVDNGVHGQNYLPNGTGADSWIEKANSFYDNFGRPSGGYAYAETEYWDDPLGRVKAQGAPGADYHLGSGHVGKQWYVSVPDKEFSSTIEIDGGNIILTFRIGFLAYDLFTGADPDGKLDAFQSHIAANDLDHKYFLSVSKDPDGNYTQSLTDAFGRTVKTWAHTGDEPIIAEYEYDILGNVTKEIAPGNGRIENSIYEYNTLGQLKYEKTPDGPEVEYEYDGAGNVSQKEFFADIDGRRTRIRRINNYYDHFGRPYITHCNGSIVMRYFYDEIDEASKFHAEEVSIPKHQINSLKQQNLRGRLVTTVTLNNGDPVVEMFGYDDDGNVQTKIMHVPHLGYTTTKYEYDIQGKLVKEAFTKGDNEDVITKVYTYDNYGRLSTIEHKENYNRKVIKYSYNKLGESDGKTFLPRLANTFPIQFDRSIRGWTEKINSPYFSEEIDYSNYYNGNISKTTLTYANVADNVEQTYSYDKVNRLTGVSSPQSQYNSTYRYDKLGRFLEKTEGDVSHTDYSYYGKTNRLKKAGKYGWDHFGNMIIDIDKKMVIEYDWRDMPKCFYFYNTLPIGNDKIFINSADGSCVVKDNTTPKDYGRFILKYLRHCQYRNKYGVKLLKKVSMVYDAAGNRVLKIEQ